MEFSVLLLSCLCACFFSQSAAFAVHQGCYVTDVNGVGAFPFKAAASDSITVEACRKLAAARYVSSFALEAGRECLLDPLNSNLTYLERFGAANACDIPCAGEARVVCGGQQQANVYFENDMTPMVVPPNEYTPVGCYKDDTTARRLTLLWVANNSMTVDLCAAVAFSEQWLVFGVSGGSECWAGQAVESAQALGVSSACTTACPGNSTQTCGGQVALSLYALKTAPWVVADSTTTPKALVATSCVGAAATSDACKGLVSAAAPVVVSQLVVLLAAVLAAVVLV